MTSVLAGDIGGTKTRLGLFDVTDGVLAVGAERTVVSAEFASLDEVAAAFLAETGGACRRACFGVAGPVRGRRATTTNLPWEIDAGRLERRLGLEGVRLVNDLEATAWGIAELDADALATLHEGGGGGGNRAVIAAGTGLGEAGLYWDGERHRPFATEGGHAGFAPRSSREIALLEHLARRHGHVSWERVLSGPGLVAIHEFLVARRGAGGPAAAAEDPAAAVVAGARAGDPLCREAVEMFVALYGAEAGNLALKLMATGGVYLAGGIAPKILDLIDRHAFVEAFVAKGRMRPLLEAIPVHVVLDDRAPLLGAARAAVMPEAG